MDIKLVYETDEHIVVEFRCIKYTWAKRGRTTEEAFKAAKEYYEWLYSPM